MIFGKRPRLGPLLLRTFPTLAINTPNFAPWWAPLKGPPLVQELRGSRGKNVEDHRRRDSVVASYDEMLCMRLTTSHCPGNWQHITSLGTFPHPAVHWPGPSLPPLHRVQHHAWSRDFELPKRAKGIQVVHGRKVASGKWSRSIRKKHETIFRREA